jgi:hypothetical protein
MKPYKSACAVVVLLGDFAAPVECDPARRARLPRFSDYPVRTVYRGKTAAVHPSHLKGMSASAIEMDKGDLIAGSKRKADFAGHYVLLRGSSGGRCTSIGALNAKTGKAFWLQSC